MADRPQIRRATASAQSHDQCDDAGEDQTDDNNNPIHSEDSTDARLMLSRE